MSALGGVLPRVIPAEDGIMTWEQIAPAIREKSYARPQTALVALENTHNMAGGTVYPTSVAREICDHAHEAGLKVHLDGARVFNAAVYLGENVLEVPKNFDSVQFCFSKGLGAPVGSMIVGSKDLIERCRVVRKMLGGGMRQVGVVRCSRVVALEEGPKRLHVDHENANLLHGAWRMFHASVSKRKKSRTNTSCTMSAGLELLRSNYGAAGPNVKCSVARWTRAA